MDRERDQNVPAGGGGDIAQATQMKVPPRPKIPIYGKAGKPVGHVDGGSLDVAKPVRPFILNSNLFIETKAAAD